MDYVVLDVETTGLFPKRADRVVEIALIRVDALGNVIEEFETLINPNRDLGPTYIHGITGEDVLRAPSFEDIGRQLLDRVEAATLIGHNIRFDLAFLNAEFSRLNCSPRIAGTICTLAMARVSAPDIPSRRLGALCNYFGIKFKDHHSAMADARATLALLRICSDIVKAGCLEELVHHLPTAGLTNPEPPRLAGGRARPLPRSVARSVQLRRKSLLETVVSRLPSGDPAIAGLDSYLDVLDHVLLDRRVTAEEEEQLLGTAGEMGLSDSAVLAAHRQYLTDLIQTAWADGVLTEFERHDIDRVRGLLGVPENECKFMLNRARNEQCSTVRSSPRKTPTLRGKSVCFTGQLVARHEGHPMSRRQAESLARTAGLEVKSGVSRKLDYLVTADPHSLSGKAKKARELGTTILAESVFWSMLGIAVD